MSNRKPGANGTMRPTTIERRRVVLSSSNGRPHLRVDDDSNYWDAMVRELSKKGFGIVAIAKITGLSEGQVQYRIPRIGTSPLDYRRGKGEGAHAALEQAKALLSQTQFLHTSVKTLLSNSRKRRDPHAVLHRDKQKA